MAEDFYTFEEVLSELQIDEMELKRLVSQGELRGFRDGASMKFRKDEVERHRKGRETEPTIILTDSDAEIGLPTDQDLLIDEGARDRETVLNADVFDTEELPTLTGEAEEVEVTEAIPMPTPVGEVEEEADEGAATIVDASAVRVPKRRAKKPTPAEAAFVGVEDYEAVSPTRASSGRISRSARLRAMQMKRQKSHVGWTVMLFLTAAFILLAGPFLFTTIRNVTPEYAVGMADKFRGIADWFLSLFVG